MEPLLTILLFICVGSLIALVLAVLHRRRAQARREEDLAKRAAKEAVQLALGILQDDQWHRPGH